MSVGILIAVLEVAAPSLLTGVGGIILAHFQNPLAIGVIKLGKKAARGDHLSEEDKSFIHEYNKSHGRGPGGDAYSMFH
tara:strand:- start:7961 stop:8197 length:237 start_codon:yes stop_codon:yes gene_type:complete